MGSLEDETAQTVLFWDILWQENFVCMNCATYLALKCAPMPPWPTSFEKSKIHEPNLEKLQFKGSKIEGFLLVFKGKCWKSSKNASILLPLNWNSSWLGWWILDFSKAVGQGGFGKYSNAKQVSQFMQTKFSCHKKSQNSTVLAVSYSSDCKLPCLMKNVLSSHWLAWQNSTETCI